MNQDNLNTVRKNYEYYCALRKRIFDAQDKECVLENDPLVKEYFETEDLINYYSDEYYFEKKEKELEELKSEEKVREYIQTKDESLVENFGEVYEYVENVEILKEDRKAKLKELYQRKQELLKEEKVKEYLANKAFLEEATKECYSDTSYLQYKAFQNIEDSDATYVCIKSDNCYNFVNMDNGKETIISKKDKKAIRNFYVNHHVIDNPEITIFGLNDMKYYYRRIYLKDNLMDAKACTEKARQYIMKYPDNSLSDY